jgi:hypothetical protein
VALGFGGGLKRCPYRGRVGVEPDWGAGGNWKKHRGWGLAGGCL